MDISGIELKKKVSLANDLMARCSLCPRRCGAKRFEGKTGFCGAGSRLKIYSYRQYLGEEPPISGTAGSGVIFFSNCTMKCVYCQNYRFSQLGKGYFVSPRVLCDIMISLQKRGCHNINLVTPSHHLPGLLEALYLANESSLKIPIVYNSSGYESVEVLSLLDGVIDIYLANMRYSDNKLALVYSETADYVEINQKAIVSMHKQVGDLVATDSGIGKRGLIIRHLVLPNLLHNSEGVLKFISESLPKKTYISLMSQYLPLHKAKDHPELSRRITKKEYDTACAMLERYDLHYGWTQTL